MYKRGFIIFGVVSLTMGNSSLPSADRFVRHTNFFCKLCLCHIFFFSHLRKKLPEYYRVHIVPPFVLYKFYSRQNAAFLSIDESFTCCFSRFSVICCIVCIFCLSGGICTQQEVYPQNRNRQLEQNFYFSVDKFFFVCIITSGNYL